MSFSKMNSHNILNFSSISKEKLDNEILKLTLSLYNNVFLSRKSVNDVIESINSFVKNLFVPFIQTKMKSELKPVASDDIYAKALFILEETKNILDKFKTEDLRFKLYESKILYITPQLYKITENSPFEIVDPDAASEDDEKNVYGAYIPLKDTLKKFFKIPNMYKVIQTYVDDLCRETTLISNYIQADTWKKKYKSSKKLHFHYLSILMNLKREII